MRSKLTQEHTKIMLANVERIAHIGSWILDIKTDQLIWSDEIYKIFEIDPKKVPATYEGFLDAIHPDDREMVNKAYLNSLTTKQPYKIEHRLQMKDGSIKAVEEWCETTFDEDGTPLVSVGTVQDVTQRFEAQDKISLQLQELTQSKIDLEAFNKHLSILIGEGNKKLEETLVKLNITQNHLIQTEKMAALGSLVAGVAHEINTPLGLGITGISHFLNETKRLKKLYENEEMDENEFLEYLDTALKLANITFYNLKRTAELVKSFKQISLDQILEERRKFHVKSYIQEVILSIDNKLKKSNVTLELDIPDTLNVDTYPGLISQIVTNLIVNSLTHAYNDDEKGKITLSVNLKDENLELHYKDDGKGISEKDIAEIFDPFFTTNKENGNSGLGLYIIYNIVTQQLQGTLVCNTKKDEGVEFIIDIPLHLTQKNDTNIKSFCV